MDWGKYIHDLRLQKGLSLRDLGEITGVPFSSIGAFELGKKEMKVPTLARLLAAMGYELTAKPTRKKGNK